jgi:hypothetical protein
MPFYLLQRGCTCEIKDTSRRIRTYPQTSATYISRHAWHTYVDSLTSFYTHLPCNLLTNFHQALDAMDKIKAIFKRKKTPTESSTAGTKTSTPGATDGTPTSVPKPTPTDTAAAPSTSEPTAPAAGENRLRRLSDKTTLVDIFSGAAPVSQNAPEPAAPAPGAAPAAGDTSAAVKDEAAKVAAP